MHAVMQILIDHGYLALFLAVLAEQFGLPVPASPFLVAAGALASVGQLNVTWALAIAMSGAMISDYTWFELGKRQGGFVLRWFNQKFAGSQSSGAMLQSAYLHYGPQSILISKFIPLFNIIAPQAAGTFKLAGWKFFALDTIAAFVWASAYMALGWVFHSRLGSIGSLIHRAGGVLGVLLVVAVAAFVFRRVCRESSRHLVWSCQQPGNLPGN
jgi:membrane protein DedA with SNARE-associated domain